MKNIIGGIVCLLIVLVSAWGATPRLKQRMGCCLKSAFTLRKCSRMQLAAQIEAGGPTVSQIKLGAAADDVSKLQQLVRDFESRPSAQSGIGLHPQPFISIVNQIVAFVHVPSSADRSPALIFLRRLTVTALNQFLLEENIVKKIIEGLSRFQEEVFPHHQELFSELASGQRPEVLLITCSDSRIDPTLLTQTKPGDLFIIRNAGNIVPAFGQAVGGVTATIEYAVMALGVKDIVICGHSNCGAMGGVLYPERVAHMKNVAAWLHYGEPARLVVEQNYSHLSGEELLHVLTEQNVLAQLNNIRTHPSVAAGLAQGTLKLHGWVYDIGDGDVTAFDSAADRFVTLRQIHAAVPAGK